MIPIEQASFTNRLDVLKKEREHIESLHAMLNSHIPSQSDKEYREKNRTKINQQVSDWHNTHKEHKKQYDKEYREKNKERKKENDKNYYAANSESIKTRQNEYYYRNYDLEREQVHCPECGASVSKDYLKKTSKNQEMFSIVRGLNYL